MIDLLKMLVICGTGLLLTTLVLCALPKSKLKDLILPFVQVFFVFFCGIYVISPIDFVPEIVAGPVIGYLDDLGAISAAVTVARQAIASATRKPSVN